MNEPIARIQTLAAATQRARVEAAEQSEVLAELRGAEIARLEMLLDVLKPVLDQVPEGVDLFDAGIMPGARPRLFIDMIGFVEMGRDRRTYRFLQDSRHGRVTVAESERLDAMAEAVTAYIARRLIEREKALASDMTIEEAARTLAEEPAETTAPARTGLGARLGHALAFIVELLGWIALFGLLAAGGFWLWQRIGPLLFPL